MLGPGHVDVVPVNEKAWDVPPFEARLVGGEVWGRGSLDMLNTVAAQAVAFACLATSRLPMRGTLIFCAVSDEEAGGADGAGFLMNGRIGGREISLQRNFHKVCCKWTNQDFSRKCFSCHGH
jgi:acetylornithine deacetylase/succinyl-diaminopimelate desuccinylase-like protein